MRSILRPALLALPILGSLAGACARRGGDAHPIVSVEVLDRAGIGVDPTIHLDRAAMEKEAIQAIERVGGFRVRDAEKGEIGWQLVVGIQLTAERRAHPDDAGVIPKDQVFRAVGVTIKLEALSADPKSGVRQRFEGEGIAGKNAPVFEPYETLTREAIASATRGIGVERDLLRGSEAELLARIPDGDPSVRARAIVIAGERKLSSAVPALIAVLKDEREPAELVMKAIGALVVIGDERAVEPLIDSARQRSPIFLGQIIFAVAQIGGKKAEAYLFTLSSGHADPEIRRNAVDALEELHRRRPSDPKAANDG